MSWCAFGIAWNGKMSSRMVWVLASTPLELWIKPKHVRCCTLLAIIYIILYRYVIVICHSNISLYTHACTQYIRCVTSQANCDGIWDGPAGVPHFDACFQHSGSTWRHPQPGQAEGTQEETRDAEGCGWENCDGEHQGVRNHGMDSKSQWCL